MKKLITQEGFNKLTDELNNLILVERKNIANKIKEAREQGDLSENADYDAAIAEHGVIESRIIELKNVLNNVEIHEDNNNKEFISLGSKVKLLDLDEDEELVFEIVGVNEVNSINNKISSESPLGSCLLGKKENDVFVVSINEFKTTYKILEIIE